MRCWLVTAPGQAPTLFLAAPGQAPTRAVGGVAATARFRVLVDHDPALPRVRIVLDPDGGFTMGKPPLGDAWRFVTIGKQSGLPLTPLKSLECTWERVEGMAAIDIDLPREMRRTAQHQPVGQPSTSTGPRPAPVTLPSGRSGAGADAAGPRVGVYPGAGKSKERF